MKAISYVIFIFFTPALILLNFNFLIFNHAFYKSQFAKLDVYKTFDAKEIVDYQSKNLIDFLCCGKELDRGFFTERERLHLADVRKIISLNQFMAVLLTAFVLIGFLILILKKDEKELAKTLMISSAIAFFAIIFLWLSALLNFDALFVKFHFLAFDNDLWQLPESSNLIKLFPAQFFANFANRIAIQTLLISAGFFGTSFFFVKRYDSKKH